MSNRLSSFLVNPFDKVAGAKALLIGLILYVSAVVIGYYQHILYYGVLSVKVVNSEIPFIRTLSLSLISVLVFALLLYIAGKLTSKSSVRLIDVIGTITLAKTPLMVISLLSCIPVFTDAMIKVIHTLLFPTLISTTLVTDYIWFGLFIFIIIIVEIWVIILSYKGFSISCNVKGAKSIVSFIITVITTEFICIALAYMLIPSNFTFTPTIDNQNINISESKHSSFLRFDSIAWEYAKDLENNDYQVIYNHFDSLMKATLSAEKLGEVLSQCEKDWGK